MTPRETDVTASDGSYVVTGRPAYLELHSGDGTYRGVIFVSEEAARAALQPGRAAIDLAAANRGFLPSGATIVSTPGLSDRAFGLDDKARRHASLVVSTAAYINVERDKAARNAQPQAARRYEQAVGPPSGVGTHD